MIDKLAIIDQMLNSETKHANKSSQDIINSKISSKYNNSKLIQIYSNLIKNKYEDIKNEQQEKARTDMLNIIKRNSRDDKTFIKRIRNI